MSCPLNKTQLLDTIQKEYAALEKFLTPLTAAQMELDPAPGAWAVKDAKKALNRQNLGG